MRKVLMGNHAASYAAKLSRVQVIAAYPITPQTQIVEELSEICANGELDAKFLKVESEHSAMACCIAASAAGARSFTATSAQGLALMHELLHWAAAARLPVVMVNVNRAMAPGWSIWADQTDSLAQRDTGWIQLYVEDNQEVLDSVIQAYKIAEEVSLPVMVCYDAFFLSHTYEPVDMPDQADVDAFLPSFKPEFKLDTDNPRSFYMLVMPDNYIELRFKIQQAMDRTLHVAADVDRQFGKKFGRSYGICEAILCEDADYVLVTSCSTTSPARIVIRNLRERGLKVGLLKLRLFRPFPGEEVYQHLSGKKKAVVIDRNISFGKGGIFADELRGALANKKDRPIFYSYVTGLGGRDITTEALEEIVLEAIDSPTPESNIIWKGVKI